MQELKEFFKNIHPFDTLKEDILEKIIASTQIGYYKKNRILIDFDEEPKYFYIILKGLVKEIDKDDEIVNIYQDQESFDAKSIIDKKSEHRFETDQETILYEIDKNIFLEVLNSSLDFKNYFLLGISHKLQKIKEQNSSKSLSEILAAKIEDTILNKPIIIDSDISITQAVKILDENRAQILIIKKNSIYGVFTDKDLRKVIINKISFDEKIEKIATYPAITIDYDQFLFNALLKMTKKGIKHLVVTKDENIIGTLELSEVLSFFSNQSYLISKNIEYAKNIEDLREVSKKFFDTVKILYHKGSKIRYLSKLMDELHTKLYKKVFELTFKDSKNCTLIVLGSEGRGEQLIRTDQDNALILEDNVDKKEFLEKAKIFTKYLIDLGYPKCPGDIMVENPNWCKYESEYKKDIFNWIENPSEENFLYLSIFLDAKSIVGSSKRVDNLKNIIYEKVSDNFSFLSNLAKPVLSFSTPLGMFNTFLTDKQNRIDLKKGGVFPIVHGARVLSLQFRIKETNTIKRVKNIENLNIIDKSFSKELIEAFETLQNFRLKASIENIEKGKNATNEINIDNLTRMEKDLLKDSFKIVDKFKKFIKFHFRLDMVT